LAQELWRKGVASHVELDYPNLQRAREVQREGGFKELARAREAHRKGGFLSLQGAGDPAQEGLSSSAQRNRDPTQTGLLAKRNAQSKAEQRAHAIHQERAKAAGLGVEKLKKIERDLAKKAGLVISKWREKYPLESLHVGRHDDYAS
jgi:hypothetical protein